ncbi:hypothetical protein KW453_21095 [Vibrio fluvialis]|nr:hypothetical protein [Vibrio fluvialis]MBY7980495.1 hypothetical protein [Vibrio fluvialis]
MSFDALFEQALASADRCIEEVMASEFHLRLRGGESLEIKAIFDSLFEQPNADVDHAHRGLMADESTLTVLNRILNKETVYAASVETPLGTKYVAKIEYPDTTTTRLYLTTKPLPTAAVVSTHDNFL